MKYFILIGLCVFLSSCASGDYSTYTTALQDHSASESIRISAQSNAISNIVKSTKTETATEATLLAVIGMLQIERLQPVKLDMVKPTTWADVGNSFVNHIPFMSAIGGMVWQSSILSQSSSAPTIKNSTITNSLNPTTAKAAGNASAVGTNPPVIVTPVILD